MNPPLGSYTCDPETAVEIPKNIKILQFSTREGGFLYRLDIFSTKTITIMPNDYHKTRESEILRLE